MSRDRGEHLTEARYIGRLIGKPVMLVFTDGKALKGTLLGFDTYNYFVRQGDLEIMIFKGALKYLHPAPE